jgi:DNA-binding GntR family transcriptional regulator
MARRADSRSKQIADALIESITSAKYPIGSTLPNEHRLSAKFKVSRATVSVALRQLEEMGLVYRRTRTGTQVVSRFPLRNQIEDGSVFQDWARYGVEYVFEVLHKEKCDLPAVAAEKSSRDARKWLHLAGHRLAIKSRAPICTVDIYVHPDYSGIGAEISNTPPRIFSVIEARHGVLIKTIEQELKAISIGAADAAELAVTPGSPALQMLRWYRGAKDKLIEFIVVTHPADRFTYKSRMLRGPLATASNSK